MHFQILESPTSINAGPYPSYKALLLKSSQKISIFPSSTCLSVEEAFICQAQGSIVEGWINKHIPQTSYRLKRSSNATIVFMFM